MKKIFVLGVIYLLCTISVFSQSKKEWERVQSVNSWNVYKQFILNYPDGKYTELAKQKLAQLKEPEANKKETEVNQPAQSFQKNEPKSQTSKKKPDQNRFKDPIYPDEPTPRSVAINKSGNSLNNIQQNDDQIMLKKKFAYLNGKEINRTELKDLLLSKPESAIEYKKAMNSITTSGVLLGVGAVFIIYAVANPPKEEEGGLPGLVSDEEMSKWMVPLYISGGCILASLPFIITGKTQFKKSVSIYNSTHSNTGYNSIQKIELGITRNGVGLVYTF